MAELSVEVPIKLSEKAQRDLYETCMAYKKLAEMRGAENDKLRELVLDLYDAIDSVFWDGEVETRERFEPRMSELGIEVTGK